MMYLHKVLPMFLLPTGLTFLLVCAGLIFRRRWPVWAGAIVLWLAATPLVSDQIMRAAEGWEVRRPASAVPTAEAIVVLSYGRVHPPGDSGASEWLDPDRFFGGVDLYKAGRAPLLVFTGGWVPWRPGATPEGEIWPGMPWNSEFRGTAFCPPERRQYGRGKPGGDRAS